MYDMFWYKQIKGQQPCAVVKAGAVADPIFHKGYMNTRFNITRSKNRLSLSIINISHWDEAVYYCGVEIFFDIEFGNGVFLALNVSSFNSTGEFLFYELKTKSDIFAFLKFFSVHVRVILSHKMNINCAVLFVFQL